eukprot:2120067-Pyramimonas_sp.AAC.1
MYTHRYGAKPRGAQNWRCEITRCKPERKRKHKPRAQNSRCESTDVPSKFFSGPRARRFSYGRRLL